MLSTEIYTTEDMLFDHPSAELLVLNANEKAKAKTLTKADAFLASSAEDDEEEEEMPAPSAALTETATEDEEDDEGEESQGHTVLSGKLRKKTPRALPKFMQREIPEEAEGILFENFRVFVKWTLELLASNASITALGAPEAVYVNMSHGFDSIYEHVNAEAEENGVQFLPLSSETDALITENLELYGGFFTPQLNKLNNFHATSQLESLKSKLTERGKQEKKQPKSGEQKSFAERMRAIWEFIKKIATTEIGGKR